MRNDIKLKCPIESPFTGTYTVTLGTAASIKRGEPTKGYDATGASWTGAVAIMADGEGTTSERFAGIAKNESNETASVAGTVTTWLPLPGLIYEAKAKTASTADTEAEIMALNLKRVVFDLTSTTWSVDAAATDAATNGVVIVGGDYHTSSLYFVVSTSCTVFE